VFAVGSYNLVLDYHYAGQATPTPTATGNITFIANDNHTDDRINKAVRLDTATTSTYFSYRGSISDSTDVDFYKVTPKAQASTLTMSVTVSALDVNGMVPDVLVYDGSARLMPTQVVTNENGTLTVQLANAAVGSSYYVRVNAFDPLGTRNVGNYAL